MKYGPRRERGTETLYRRGYTSLWDLVVWSLLVQCCLPIHLAPVQLHALSKTHIITSLTWTKKILDDYQI
jgi:hypothetical protein